MPSPDSLRCRVLIVDAPQYPMVRPVLKSLKNAPVLTVGNGPGLIQVGGMIDLVVEDRRVQFDASLDAVRAANLDVSARLLRLSRNLRRAASGTF